MSSQLMPTTEEFELMQRMAKVYATSIYKNEPVPKILAMMLRAWGLGLPVTEAPDLFHELHGKLTLSANAMATLMKRAGYSWRVPELDDDAVTVVVLSSDGEKLGESRFTMDDARQANIISNNRNWQQYPRNMLMARALSNAVRWYAPDALAGAPIYTPEELGDSEDTGFEFDDMDGTPPAPPLTPVRVPDPQPDAAPAHYEPPGEKGALDGKVNAELFAVGNELAEVVGQKFDSWRKDYAAEVLGPGLESFTQLNTPGAQVLITDMLGQLAYGQDAWGQKEVELCQSVQAGATALKELSPAQLLTLKRGIRNVLRNKRNGNDVTPAKARAGFGDRDDDTRRLS